MDPSAYCSSLSRLLSWDGLRRLLRPCSLIAILSQSLLRSLVVRRWASSAALYRSSCSFWC